MRIASILSPSRTFCGLEVSSKKRAIEHGAQFIAACDPRLDEGELYRSLIAREKISPTGLGHGIALPHCRLPNCTGIVGALVTLSEPIDFEAIDDEPVSTLFYVIVPEQQTDSHLTVLSMLMKKFNDPLFRQRLRLAKTAQELYLAAVSESAS
jgi:PTS system nitrogen regulatory IIA component